MDQPQSTSMPESLVLRLHAMINSHWITQALSVAAQLSLPNLLASGPKRSAYLAQATGVHAPSLRRLLRALVTIEIIREREDGTLNCCRWARYCGAMRPRRCVPGRSLWAGTINRRGATSFTSWSSPEEGSQWARSFMPGLECSRAWAPCPMSAMVLKALTGIRASRMSIPVSPRA
jgi:hypothetical protein